MPPSRAIPARAPALRIVRSLGAHAPQLGQSEDTATGKTTEKRCEQARMRATAVAGTIQPMVRDQQHSNPRALALATAAFTVCFFAWSMLGPLGPTLQKQLDLSEFQLAVAVAIPVVLGSVMRIPIGMLTERYGGRLVFTALMAYSVVPLVLLALFHDSFAAVVDHRLPARRHRRVVRGRRPVREPLVCQGAPGVRARPLRDGHGRHRARRTDRAEDRQALEPGDAVLDRRRADGRS